MTGGAGTPPTPRRTRAAPASRAPRSAEAGAVPVPEPLGAGPHAVGGSLAPGRTELSIPYPPAFYDRDPRLVARELLGAVLECRTPEGVARGRVVETEAYLGPHDPACHAVAGRTRRTWHLHGPPGVAYVYRIYGIHWCFNAVTLPEGVGSAVLVRALAPLAGVPLMRARRGHPPEASSARHDHDLTNGLGKLCAALGITGAADGTPLDTGSVRLSPDSAYADADVLVTPRIGITRAADWPLRYLVRDSPFVSRTPAAFYRRPYRPGADDV